MEFKKPTEVTIHWLPESWGYYPAHWSQYLPVGSGHDCNDKCYVVKI